MDIENSNNNTVTGNIVTNNIADQVFIFTIQTIC